MKKLCLRKHKLFSSCTITLYKMIKICIVKKTPYVINFSLFHHIFLFSVSSRQKIMRKYHKKNTSQKFKLDDIYYYIYIKKNMVILKYENV